MTKKKEPLILSLHAIDIQNKEYNPLGEADKLEISKPFEIQLFGMPEDHVSNMTLNQDDRVWLLRKDETRDRIIRADLWQYIDNIYNKTSVLLVTQLGEVLTNHWNRVMERLDGFEKSQTAAHLQIVDQIKDVATDIEKIQGDISEINGRLDLIEGKQETDEERIARLEEIAKLPLEFNERITKIENDGQILEDVKNYIALKWIIVRGGVILIISVLTFLVIHSYWGKALHGFLKLITP